MPFMILGLQSAEKPFVEVDEYVPATVRWSGYARLRRAPRSFMVDAGASLVEVKTDADSGAVVEIVLVDIASPERYEAPLTTPGRVDAGVPLVTFDDSAQDSADGVHLYRDGLRIRFSQGPATRRVGDSEAVFSFSEIGHLVDFDVWPGLERMALLRAVCGLGEA
ncbi:hypothetical protein [Streptomyces sp. NBC_00847]|uniref:hypothetical protein n=1 Tax=Streptomyces sp. NBC_00847 TaxID=2975850 RepID=UPI0022587979|nr:hypothetical protein [Streptomyces sp. NBC_00847]MCX4883528.1 hypothetical protein [Streptomyces sp. NBC_00847]